MPIPSRCTTTATVLPLSLPRGWPLTDATAFSNGGYLSHSTFRRRCVRGAPFLFLTQFPTGTLRQCGIVPRPSLISGSDDDGIGGGGSDVGGGAEAVQQEETGSRDGSRDDGEGGSDGDGGAGAVQQEETGSCDDGNGDGDGDGDGGSEVVENEDDEGENTKPTCIPLRFHSTFM